LGIFGSLLEKNVKSKMQPMLFVKLPEIKCFLSYDVFGGEYDDEYQKGKTFSLVCVNL
jgi:hypothetical protein